MSHTIYMILAPDDSPQNTVEIASTRPLDQLARELRALADSCEAAALDGDSLRDLQDAITQGAAQEDHAE